MTAREQARDREFNRLDFADNNLTNLRCVRIDLRLHTQQSSESDRAANVEWCAFHLEAMPAIRCFSPDFFRLSRRIRSISAIVSGSSQEPCGPGTIFSDRAPSKCELQYGTTPSVQFGQSPFPRSPMIEW